MQKVTTSKKETSSKKETTKETSYKKETTKETSKKETSKKETTSNENIYKDKESPKIKIMKEVAKRFQHMIHAKCNDDNKNCFTGAMKEGSAEDMAKISGWGGMPLESNVGLKTIPEFVEELKHAGLTIGDVGIMSPKDMREEYANNIMDGVVNTFPEREERMNLADLIVHGFMISEITKVDIEMFKTVIPHALHTSLIKRFNSYGILVRRGKEAQYKNSAITNTVNKVKSTLTSTMVKDLLRVVHDKGIIAKEDNLNSNEIILYMCKAFAKSGIQM
jgi:hypothetical protein